MPKPDFTFSTDGLFVSVMPETPEAARIWNEQIAPATDGTGKLHPLAFSELQSELRKAGYSCRQAVAPRISDAALLRALGS